MAFWATVGFYGCAATQRVPADPFFENGYKALTISVNSYDAAMKSLRDLYNEGTIPKDTAQKAWDAGEKFFYGQKLAFTALRTYKQASGAQTKVEAINAMNMAAVDLAGFLKVITPWITASLTKEVQGGVDALKKGGTE
jgi:hypothetical protein